MNTPTQKEKARIRMIAMGIMFVLPVIILWSSLTYTVDSGHAGLIFHTFGTVKAHENSQINAQNLNREELNIIVCMS